MRRCAPVVITALCLLMLQPAAGQIEPFGGAAAYVQDLRERRAALMDALGADTVLVLWSAPKRVYSTDTDYEYRQESNFLYLTGLDEEAAALVLVPGASGPREYLFVRARDPFQELWNGPIPSPEEVAARTGINDAQVFPQRTNEAFESFFRGLLTATASADEAAAQAAGAAVAPRPGPLTLAMLPDPAAGPLAADRDYAAQVAWARQQAEARPGLRLSSVSALLERQRRVKTPYEQNVMRRAVEIAAEAHLEGMKATRPGRWEYEVEAAIEYWFLRNGAMSWGYPSIVGSGPNATVLHYLKSTRRMEDGDLLLVDAGANFQGLTGDITRTWPVNGRFSADQRVIYDIVLEALEAGIAAAKPNGTVAEITSTVRAVIGAGLLRVGLVTDANAMTGRSSQIDLWFPHGPVHGIGMDVHESLGALEPGTTFVVEPGIYVRPDTLARLEQTQPGLARDIRPAVERFADIGIRIEDSLLMTAAGPEVMSGKAPKRPADIERVVGVGN